MTSYFITGATGFIGRRVLPRLLETQPDAVVHALVRQQSIEGFADAVSGWVGAQRLHLISGDLTADGLGIDSDTPIPDHVDHVLHLGAIYDMNADAASQQAANVDGTTRVTDFALAHDALLHHVSSIAVSGDHRGIFTEDDFDTGQHFPTPYHRTKYQAEKVVRERSGLRWRVYRPSIVVGDSVTGEMDKVDGPYYFFGHLRRLGALPSRATIPMPDLGNTNIVPVDFVADAIVALMTHRPQLNGQVYHLVDPITRSITDLYNALAPAFGGPRGRDVLSHRVVGPVVTQSGRGAFRTARDLVALQLKIPPAVLDTTELPAVFTTESTTPVLQRYGVSVPDLVDYGPRLFDHWAGHLDPSRFARPDPRGPLVGRHILITGGSAGIGLETARICVRKGATVFILARRSDDLDAAVRDIGSDIRSGERSDVPPGSVHAYTCDITDPEAVALTVKTILAEHDHVDVLVNNAGRSIRRATINATDRSHDYHRTMAVNYFGAVEMVLALLPHMTGRRNGHIVNVSSIGVQARGPRFAAYVASKSALEAFSDITAAETLSDHVTFTNIHMPLTRTRMIAPTDSYDRALALTAEKAAAIVVRGIVEKPKRIDTPLGTLAQVGQFLLPGVTARVQHQGFLMFPESTAARRDTVSAPDTVVARDARPEKADSVSMSMSVVHRVRDQAQAVAHPVKSAVVDSGVRRLVRKSLNVVPGVHW